MLIRTGAKKRRLYSSLQEGAARQVLTDLSSQDATAVKETKGG
jgi:hypothetical protein